MLNSIDYFIAEQKKKLQEEKLNLSEKLENVDNLVNQQTEENDCEKHIGDTYFAIEERENINPNTRKSNSVDFLQENGQKMLNYGEFNPKMRVATLPYLGLGEYEQRRQTLMEQRKADYQQYAEKVKRAAEQDNNFIKNNFKGSRPVSQHSRSSSRDKAVQTDIQNVHTQLIQYETPPTQITYEKQMSPRNRALTIDKVQIETQNNIIVPGYNKFLDKLGVTSSRAKLMADLQSSYFPTSIGYTPTIRDDEERLEKVRRQEKYLAELRQQVEEKQRLLQKHKEEEKMQQELETRRLEAQLRDINIDEKQIIGSQSCSTDVSLNTKEFDNKSDSTCSKNKWNNNRHKSWLDPNITTPHSDITNKKITSNSNSPQLLRRNRPPYTFNIPENSLFSMKNRLDKDNSKLALNIHNFTTKNKSNHKKRVVHSGPGGSKIDESLPIPVLKAQSPVAKELINALPVQSKTSEAMRKLEDKWQIPAVQKNIIKSNAERPSEKNNHGILTQLGAIRLQLQQEQLRLDETLRKHGTSQTVVQADVHHNNY